MLCLNCGFHKPIGEIDVKVRSCLMCGGFKTIKIPIKINHRTIKVKVSNNYSLRQFEKGFTLNENNLRNLIRQVIPLDLFDFNAHYDSSLTYEENKNLIIGKLKELGYWNKLVEIGIIDLDFEVII